MSQVKEENQRARYLLSSLLCIAWFITCIALAESGLSVRSPAGEQPKINCLNKKPKKAELCKARINNVPRWLTKC